MNNPKNDNTQNFFGMLLAWLQTLPTDLKILIEMIGDNALDMKARSLAVGATIYILSPIDLIPEKLPIIGYIDDVLILRIALVIILEIDPHRANYYREKYPPLQTLEQQVALIKETLGALYAWLKALVEKLPTRRYHGKSTEEVAASERLQEEIFDEAMEYAAVINVDPEVIELSLLTTPPSRIIELLSSGLEEEQKRQIEAEKEQEGATQLTAALDNFRKLLGRGT